MMVSADSMIDFSDTWCRSREIHGLHDVSEKLTMMVGRLRRDARKPHKG
jgi:hypothetical protein